MTPEEIYALYHRETHKAKGVNVRSIKNFDNAKSKPTWVYFEKCAEFLRKNSGHVDGEIYIKALAKDAEGWFNPKDLGSFKTIKIYKQFLKHNEEKTTPEFIKGEVMRSIKYVVKHCRKKNYTDFSEYLSENMYLIPTVCSHYDSGLISPYFLASLNGFEMLLGSYPIDVVDDYMKTYLEDMNVFRLRVVSNKGLQSVTNKIENVINKMLKKDNN